MVERLIVAGLILAGLAVFVSMILLTVGRQSHEGRKR